MIAEGSTTAGRHMYNHVVWLHKVTYEAIIPSGNGLILRWMYVNREAEVQYLEEALGTSSTFHNEVFQAPAVRVGWLR